MNIIKNPNFGTHNTNVRLGKIEYIAIHYVGATGDADDNVSYYNNPSTTQASADFFVGHTGDVWQYNPDPKARYTWAVGGRKQTSYGGTLYNEVSNKNSISIEMCVKTKGSRNANSPDWYFTDATVDATVELTKYLMDKYDVPVSKVIRHFDVNGKLCPGVVGWNSASGSESAWNAFKARLTEKPSATPVEWYRVRKSWADAKSQLGAFKDLKRAESLADKNPGYNVYDSSGYCVYYPDDSNETKPTGKVTVKEWQTAAVADGRKFARYGIDGIWGAECESVAKNTLVMWRRNSYAYNNLTKIVQRVVGATVDGLCGKETDAAIREYQRKNGLTVDGVVGLKTWRKILGV